jgi:TonB family protein
MEVSPRPEYPAQAVAAHVQGCGKFQIDCDRTTGKATGVKVLQSTGAPILDKAAIAAYYRWRTHPNTVVHIVVPVCFSIVAGKPTVN